LENIEIKAHDFAISTSLNKAIDSNYTERVRASVLRALTQMPSDFIWKKLLFEDEEQTYQVLIAAYKSIVVSKASKEHLEKFLGEIHFNLNVNYAKSHKNLRKTSDPESSIFCY